MAKQNKKAEAYLAKAWAAFKELNIHVRLVQSITQADQITKEGGNPVVPIAKAEFSRGTMTSILRSSELIEMGFDVPGMFLVDNIDYTGGGSAVPELPEGFAALADLLLVSDAASIRAHDEQLFAYMIIGANADGEYKPMLAIWGNIGLDKKLAGEILNPGLFKSYHTYLPLHPEKKPGEPRDLKLAIQVRQEFKKKFFGRENTYQSFRPESYSVPLNKIVAPKSEKEKTDTLNDTEVKKPAESQD